MNEKLYKEEFRNILKREYGMSEREAADALNKFFSLVIKALEEERYVKIKGLGIFKLIDVESRKSVDVNTGEGIEIPEHRKISYTVDSSLKELINRPFAHFEVIELKQDSPMEEGMVEVQPTDIVVDDEKVASENLENTEMEDGVEVKEEPVVVEDANGGVKTDIEAEEEISEKNESEDVEQTECEESMDENRPFQPKEQVRRKLIDRRENWREMELEMEKEERSNKMTLLTISLFMFLLMLMGLLFILAPEFLEEIFY
ncbi:MAG: HU family DNA-binding protein [Bacteroidaceae bacterium]|nr:HU family DNA-binding protein [Bacteroidaceae bacterium]